MSTCFATCTVWWWWYMYKEISLSHNLLYLQRILHLKSAGYLELYCCNIIGVFHILRAIPYPSVLQNHFVHFEHQVHKQMGVIEALFICAYPWKGSVKYQHYTLFIVGVSFSRNHCILGHILSSQRVLFSLACSVFSALFHIFGMFYIHSQSHSIFFEGLIGFGPSTCQ